MSANSITQGSTKEALNKSESSIPKMITVKQFCELYPWPTESGIRSYIYRAEELEMTEAFVRVGRRVLIDVDKFFQIIQEGRKQ